MKRDPVIHAIEVEHNGTRHRAEYTAEKGALIVYYGKATISGTYGRLLAKDEARLLLIEHLVQNGSVAALNKDATEDRRP